MGRRNLNRLRHLCPHSDTLWDSGEAQVQWELRSVPARKDQRLGGCDAPVSAHVDRRFPRPLALLALGGLSYALSSVN